MGGMIWAARHDMGGLTESGVSINSQDPEHVDLVRRAFKARHRMASLHPPADSGQVRWRMAHPTWHTLVAILSPPDAWAEPDGTIKLLGIPVERVREMPYGALEWAVQA